MLNKLILSSSCFRKASLAFIILALFINLNCGKRKPPQPPVERISQRVEIAGKQQGNVITLFWSLPPQNTSDKNTLNISRADIYRLAETLDASLTLSEEEFASRSTLISSVKISQEDFQRGQVSYTDLLQFSGQSARLRYAVRFVNAAGQKAAFSNFLLIEPTAKVAANPTSLVATIAEEEIVLKWDTPKANVDGTEPSNILGFNIYRTRDKENSPAILNKTPITDNIFRDRSFEFGVNYGYFVRTVSLGSNGDPVESSNSNTIEVQPRDIFAPSPPSAITIAAAPDNLAIFFAVNPEKDIAGYRIYRSTNRDQPLSNWTLLTDQLLTTNTFQDKKVETGKTYYYYLTAVDTAGNASKASIIVSEIAP